MADHERDSCPHRPFTCPHCGHEGTYETITEKHWPKCDKYPLRCPNGCSDVSIERRQLKRHLSSDCPEEEVDCEFLHAGCRARMKRCKLSNHMDENVQQHLHSLAKYTFQLHTHASASLAHSWRWYFRTLDGIENLTESGLVLHSTRVWAGIKCASESTQTDSSLTRAPTSEWLCT